MKACWRSILEGETSSLEIRIKDKREESEVLVGGEE